MVLTLEDMGFEIEASHHEVAPAQHEIDFKYDEALKTADNIQTFKMTVKTIAKRHGLYAHLCQNQSLVSAVLECILICHLQLKRVRIYLQMRRERLVYQMMHIILLPVL